MSRTITNYANLPLPLVEAVRNDDYSRGDSDISCTQLISPPQKVELERRHADEIEEDVADRIYALIGQIGHAILDRAKVDGYRSEERVSTEVLGWKVSGAFDLFYVNERGERTLADFKLVSVWEAIGGPKKEREQQLNILAELMRRNGEQVDRCEVIYLFRDWSKLKARREPDSYPQQQALTYFIPMWSPERATAFLEERVRLHQQARAGHLEPCSEEDRWARPTTYAVMKEGRKTAMRVLKSYEDAYQWAEDKGHVAEGRFGDVVEQVLKKGISIVERPGESVRCAAYCYALKFCVQGQEMVSAVGIEAGDDE